MTKKSDGGSQPATLVVCPCNNCSGNLEFDSTRAGETVVCPHCGMDTVLFIPQGCVGLPQSPFDSPPVEPKLTPKPQPKKAKIVELQKELTTYAYGGAIERRLEITGETLSVVGNIAGVCGLVAAGVLVMTDQFTSAFVCGMIAIFAFAQGSVINTLFKAGAEIVRLLKKSNGLPFMGEISQPSFQFSYVCSACGASVVPLANTKCPSCGAEFEPGSIKGKEKQ